MCREFLEIYTLTWESLVDGDHYGVSKLLSFRVLLWLTVRRETPKRCSRTVEQPLLVIIKASIVVNYVVHKQPWLSLRRYTFLIINFSVYNTYDVIQS